MIYSANQLIKGEDKPPVTSPGDGSSVDVGQLLELQPDTVVDSSERKP